MTIRREDLEAKLREIEDVVDETKANARNTAVIAVVAIVVIIALAFLFGKRRGGKAPKPRIEIYGVS